MNGVPLAVILGEDELARGEVKLKELGLPEGHPEKEGVTVSLENLAEEVRKRTGHQSLSKVQALQEATAGLTLDGAR